MISSEGVVISPPLSTLFSIQPEPSPPFHSFLHRLLPFRRYETNNIKHNYQPYLALVSFLIRFSCALRLSKSVSDSIACEKRYVI